MRGRAGEEGEREAEAGEAGEAGEAEEEVGESECVGCVIIAGRFAFVGGSNRSPCRIEFRYTVIYRRSTHGREERNAYAQTESWLLGRCR